MNELLAGQECASGYTLTAEEIEGMLCSMRDWMRGAGDVLGVSVLYCPGDPHVLISNAGTSPVLSRRPLELVGCASRAQVEPLGQVNSGVFHDYVFRNMCFCVFLTYGGHFYRLSRKL